MRIDPKGSIIGRPALEIRGLLRHGRGGLWTLSYVSERLSISASEAQNVIDDLLDEGYIETADTGFDGSYWQNTIQGNALAMASAAKPVRRATAEKKVREFQDRVHHVNESAYYLYKVARVVVFGSFLTDQEKLNDVDLAIELQPKYQDSDEQLRREQERIREAYRNGRTFRYFAAGLSWPRDEVWLFLKSRSRTISLHGIDEINRLQVQCHTLFVADNSQYRDSQ